jgi:hypothetical protein
MYGRPVEAELIEIFEQNNQINVTIREATEILCKYGHHHSDKSVRDNLLILTNSGFLTYDQVQHQFSLSANAAKADLTKKMPCELLSKPKHPDHCDKCGRKFSHGDVFYIRPFANLELYLCSDCHVPKVVA